MTYHIGWWIVPAVVTLLCCWSKKKKQWCDWPDQDRFENWQPIQFIEIPK